MPTLTKKLHLGFFRVGSFVVIQVSKIGRFFFFALEVVFKFTSHPFRTGKIFFEAYQQGVASLPVILATSTVTGMVLALQLVTTLNRFGAEAKAAQVLAISLVRELGPVLASLMFVGKAGGRMASEIGTMSVNDQIKALRVMAIDPINFLIVNRVLAGLLCLPLLVTIFDLTGIFAGAGMMFVQQEMTLKHFVNQILQVVSLADFIGGWLKAIVFSFLITLICCFRGYTATGGSAGVGEATTNAVATSSILVIVCNLVITKFNMVFLD